ncbi:MAG: phage baseplate assembly protein V [Kineosporiaceae bacterium]
MSVTATASPGTALAPLLLVDGQVVGQKYADALVELRLLTALRTIGRSTLRFTDPGYALVGDAAFALGRKVEVRARGRGQHDRAVSLFEGTVTSVGLEQPAGGVPELVVVVVEDGAYALSRQAHAATYQTMSWAGIIEKVVAGAGLRSSVSTPPGDQDYVLQADTDLAFVDEVARRYGCDWIVAGSTFHFWPNNGRSGTPLAPEVALAVGDSLLEFTVRVHDDPPRKVAVRGWDARRQELVQGVADAEKAGAVPPSLAEAVRAKPTGTGLVLTTLASPTDATDAKRLATAMLKASGWVTARGRGPLAPGLRPGGTVTVSGVGPAGGSYPVVEVEHVYRADGFWTRFTAGDRAPAGLAAIASGGPGAVGAAYDPGHAGLLVGTVSDLADPEGFGRVRVRLETLGDQVTTAWARVATVGGGKARGVTFLPEVGDEVLVGFEGGDSRRPVVLGGLFGSRDTLPTKLTAEGGGSVQARRLSSRLGHVVELSDGSAPAEQHVLLSLAGGQARLRLGKDRADLEVPTGVPLTITAGASSIELDGAGKVALKGAEISVKGTVSVTIEAPQVTLTATGPLKASGATVAVEGRAQATLEAAGQTVVKGGVVMIN